MKTYAIHDTRGSISGCIVCPSDGPPAGVQLLPGQTLTEIESFAPKVNPKDPECLQRLLEELRHFRIRLKAEVEPIRKSVKG